MIWLAIVAFAGFLFATAAMLPRSPRYRIRPPLLLAVIPVLLLAHTIAVHGLKWEAPPTFLATPRFYMNSPFQFGLATWVGVALVASLLPRWSSNTAGLALIGEIAGVGLRSRNGIRGSRRWSVWRGLAGVAAVFGITLDAIPESATATINSAAR